MLAMSLALMVAALGASPTGTEPLTMLDLRTLLPSGPPLPPGPPGTEAPGGSERVSLEEAKRRAPREPPAVSVTAEVSGKRIHVTAVISNPETKAVDLSLTGVTFSPLDPFSAYLEESGEVRLKPVDGDHPSVWAEYCVVVLPARSQARITAEIDLDDYKYRGSPSATVAWNLGIVEKTRGGGLKGQIQVKLPSRWLW